MALPTPINGATPGGRRRVHAVPKTIIFEVEVMRDGELTFVEMVGYHRERCPVWVDIEVDAARDAYLEQAFVEQEVTDPQTGETTTERVFHWQRAVEARYRRDVLVAVVQGLQEHEADALLGSEDGLTILTDLGWFTRPTAQNAQETPADPEAEGEETQAAPTGAASSPARRRSTAASTS